MSLMAWIRLLFWRVPLDVPRLDISTEQLIALQDLAAEAEISEREMLERLI